ncbi:MAG TPA: dihydrofolate reductase family protein [Conexibacter sp.]|nr:dihydrofolate reductase family protein [Conexibacter sp.]
MSGKVKVNISVSLDGYVAGPGDGPQQPLGRGGEALHEWVIATQSWREMHGYEGGTSGVDSQAMAEAVEGVGAVVIGRRMFDLGEPYWGEDPPFRMPVFVVTHEPREALVRGATTFAFVTGGPAGAVDLAREAAGDGDVSVGGGADVIRQLLRADLVDELSLHVVPVLLGGGASLFEGVGPDARFEQVRAVEGSGVTHLSLRVTR